jgi:cysteine-rich repeat protein
MKPLHAAIVASIAGLSAACGADTRPGDAGSDTGADTAGDTTPDTSDATPDSTPDTDGDTGADTSVDTGTDTGTTGTLPPIINEVAPAGDPTDWFELYNPNDTPIALDQYFFSDDPADPTRALFEFGTTIPARGYYVQLMDTTFPGFALGTAESVAIADVSGVVVAEVSWNDGDAPATTSWGRFPDLTGEFMTLYTPTPGAPNAENPPPECGDGRVDPGEECDDGNTTSNDDCSATCEIEVVVENCGNGRLDVGEQCDDGRSAGTRGCSATCTLDSTLGIVVINEATASSSTGIPDYIELASVAPFAVRLDRFSVTDNDPTHQFALDASYTLSAGGYLVLTRDEPGSFTWGLGAADGVRLYDPAGELLDSTDWADGENPADQSWGRFPDKTGSFSTRVVTSPGSANP